MKKLILLLILFYAFEACASEKPIFFEACASEKPIFIDKQDDLVNQISQKKYFKKLSLSDLKKLHEYVDARFEYFYYLNEGEDIKKGIESFIKACNIVSEVQDSNLADLNSSILFVEVVLAQSLTKYCREEIENLYSSFMLKIDAICKEREEKQRQESLKLPKIKSKKESKLKEVHVRRAN